MISYLIVDVPRLDGGTEPVELQTYLAPAPWRDTVRVGDDTGIDWSTVARAYVPLRRPTPSEPIVALQTYPLEPDDALGWLRLVFEDGTLTEATPVDLTAEALDAAHAIDRAVAPTFEALTGVQMWDRGEPVEGFAERLREALARG